MLKTNKFSKIVFLITFLFIFLSAAFSVIVDPYWIFNSPRFIGFNFLKPKLDKIGYEIKPINVFWRRPKAVFIGSSSTEQSIDTENLPGMDNAYNLGLPGGSLQASFDELKLSSNLGAETVYFGLDYIRFNIFNFRRQATQFPPLAFSGSGTFEEDFLGPIVRTTFGFGALSDSLETIRLQPEALTDDQKKTIVRILRSGLRNPSHVDEIIAQRGGVMGAFRSILNEQVTLNLFPPPCYTWSFRGRDGERNAFDLIREMSVYARKNSVHLVLFIPPKHVTWLLFLRQTDLYDDYEFWKRELTKITEDSKKYEGKGKVTLFDFNVVSPETVAAIPIGVENSEKGNFSDALHPRPSLGKRVVAAITNDASDKSEVDFGAKLTASNIEEHLRSVRKKLAEITIRDSETIKLMRDVTSTYRKWISDHRESIENCQYLK
jgi:hypothetical protein